MVRRHLNYDVDQWQRLPWPIQMAYLEGLADEFYDPDEAFTDDTDLVETEALGVNVQRVTA